MLPCFVLNRSHRFNNVMRARYMYMFVGTGVLCMLPYDVMLRVHVLCVYPQAPSASSAHVVEKALPGNCLHMCMYMYMCICMCTLH